MGPSRRAHTEWKIKHGKERNLLAVRCKGHSISILFYRADEGAIVSQGLWAALKADTLSLLSFEVGLFGWMAVRFFVFFHPHLKPTDPTYWFMMQLGMIVGFFTSLPANRFLLTKGIKEAM